MDIKIDYTPTDYQSALHANLQSHFRGSVHCVKAVRQCGKSICLEMILLKNALTKVKTNNYCVSPTNNQASKIFNDIRDAIAGTPILKKSNEQKLSITLYNGSSIKFFSAESGQNLRGYTADLLCVDEAAYIDDTIFYSCILPWKNVKHAPVIIVSTPRFKSGFFYKYFNLGQSNYHGKYFSYDWSKEDTSMFLTEEMKEEYRMQMPHQVYLSEILGQWLDMQGSVFGSFESVIGDDKEKRVPTDNHYMGIDWATGSGGDYTAITVFNQDKVMKEIYHFNDKDSTETIDIVCDAIKKWKPLKCQIEMNSIGSVFHDLLKKEMQKRGLANETMLLEFHTSNESKAKIVNSFQVAIQNKTVTLLNDPNLITELSVYECKPSKTGKLTYNAASGYHDDILISSMLALDCINKGQQAVFFI